MILLLGGTTEAKQAASCLDQEGVDYIYSTRTEVTFDGKGIYRFGSLDPETMRDLCAKQGVSLIIDACHPFAKELHTTVACLTDKIRVIRFEREFSKRITHPLVSYMSSYNEALLRIQESGYQSMLALTGVQSIPLLRTFWQKFPCWFRILDRKYSTDFAARHQFPFPQLLFGLPQEKEEEIALFTKLKPEVILTKESGLNGKLDAKTDAAIACNIPIFIIEKPELPVSFKIVHDLEELLTMLRDE